jgi:hypothetical protein
MKISSFSQEKLNLKGLAGFLEAPVISKIIG